MRTGTPRNTPHQLVAEHQALIGSGDAAPGQVAFVGRDAELHDLQELQPRTRTLTLVGPGGVGKSRLLHELATAIAPSFGNRMSVIDVDEIPPDGSLWQMLATRLQLPRAVPDQIMASLRGQKRLLVFDNCGSDVPAIVQVVAEILANCPDVSVLTTSREPLAIAAEVRWTVPRLSLANAVRLLVLGVQTRQPRFAVTDHNAAELTEICHRLNGLPLTILMLGRLLPAASAAGFPMTVDARQLLELEDTTHKLARHRSLRASLDWDYAALSHRERVLLSRLTVFDGEWTLAAAEAVCSDLDIPADQIGPLLTHLVDRSLLDLEHQTERYSMFEVVREYAREPRLTSGNTPHLQRRRAAYLLTLANTDALYAERDNLNAALSWAVDAHQTDIAVKLALASYPLWYRHGLIEEGRGWIARLLALNVQDAQPEQRACLAYVSAHLALLDADIAAARVSAAEVERERPGLAEYLHLLLALATADTANARTLLPRRASGPDIETPSQAPDWLGVAALIARAHLAVELNELRHASQLADRAGLAARKRDDRFWLGRAMYVQGLVALDRGQRALANCLVEQAIGVQSEDGDTDGLIHALHALGRVRLESGAIADSMRTFRDALDLAVTGGLRLLTLDALDGIAAAGVSLHSEQAVRLFAACQSMRRQTGAHAWPRRRRWVLAWLEHGLGRTLRSSDLTARAAGPVWTWTELIDLGRQISTPERSRPLETVPDLLTPRERQVAEFLKLGLSNQQIAARMTISVGTVRAHVEHILVKLGFHSRAQVALWALREQRLFA